MTARRSRAERGDARKTASIKRISEGDYSSYSTSQGGSLSADGRWIAFVSADTNLVSPPLPLDFTLHAYVRDMPSGTTTLVSVNHSGTATGNGASGSSVMSADGRRVAFVSFATDSVVSPSVVIHGQDNIYVRDLPTGTTTLLTADSTYTHGAGGGTISAPKRSGSNGTVVPFTSASTNLVRINETNYLPGFTTEVYFKRLAP